MGHRGQAIVEFALVLPLMLFICLGFVEAGFLLATQATQARATGVVADYAAAHPTEAPWDSVIALEGLASCAVAVTTPMPDIVHVESTCYYDPRVTHGLWEGLPITVEADAALPAPTPSPTPMPTPVPS